MSEKQADVRIGLVFRAVMDLMELAMERAGVKRLEIRKRPDGGFDFKVRADDGGDVRACYSRLVEFTVDGADILPSEPSR